MEEWIKLGVAISIGGMAFKSVSWLWHLYRNYNKLRIELTDAQKESLDLREKQRDEALLKVRQLQDDLRQRQRDLEEKEDLGRQDRAHIRLLKIRLRDNRVEFDDIEEQIQKFFSGNGR